MFYLVREESSIWMKWLFTHLNLDLLGYSSIRKSEFRVMVLIYWRVNQESSNFLHFYYDKLRNPFRLCLRLAWVSVFFVAFIDSIRHQNKYENTFCTFLLTKLHDMCVSSSYRQWTLNIHSNCSGDSFFEIASIVAASGFVRFSISFLKAAYPVQRETVHFGSPLRTAGVEHLQLNLIWISIRIE